MQGICTHCGRTREIAESGRDYQLCSECKTDGRRPTPAGKVIELKGGKKVRLSGTVPTTLKLGGKVYDVQAPAKPGAKL